ncbi:hypothetical protein NKF06_07230 [Haloferax sp. AB510]|nr:hypothetical protein [Haloferax sp. AB510]
MVNEVALPCPPSHRYPTTPTKTVNFLNNYSPELLRHVANYAEELTEQRDRVTRLPETEAIRSKGRPENRLDDVPSEATVTEKKINDNRYDY